MKRRAFITLFVGAASWPLVARAQNQTNPSQNANDQVGQVATVQGKATVARGNAGPATLKFSDAVYKKDVLQTGANASLGVTFDDETTLSLSANARVVVNEFVYEEGGKGKAVVNIARGTVAFVAGLMAKTGDMTISTPTAFLGIRGTTGVVDVPDNAAAGAGEAKIKLYPDADGRVGQIEVFNPQGGRLGSLTQASSAFAIRQGSGGRIAAVPFQIPPLEAARDRAVVQRLFTSHNIGRQIAIQRGNCAHRTASSRTISGSPVERRSRIAVQAFSRKASRARHSGAVSGRNYGSPTRSHRRKKGQYASPDKEAMFVHGRWRMYVRR